jgi:hypothetical protein
MTRLLPRAFPWLLGLLALLLFTLVIPRGPDYELQPVQAAVGFLRGTTRLYDSGSPGFFNAPWMLFILWPLVLLPSAGGLIVWRALNLVGLISAPHIFGGEEPVWVRVLATCNFYTFTLLVVGNMDGIVLLGVALGWLAAQKRRPWLMSVGLWLLTLKPFNVALVGLVLLLALWKWTWPERLIACSLPLVSLALSFPIFGWDWPARYLANLRASPPWPLIVTTIWRAGEKLGIPLWLLASLALLAVGAFLWALITRGPTHEVVALALATNLAVSPYALEPHYVLLAPTFLFIGQRRKELVLLAYLTALGIYSLRIFFGWDYVWLAVLYPLILLAGSWYALLAKSVPSVD